MTTPGVLEGAGIERRFGVVQVLRGVSLALAAGEWVSLLGPSGCGKTSLLQVLGLLDAPDAGVVRLDGRDASSRSSASRTALRLARIGFVFQQGNLLDHWSARDNVALPAWRLGATRTAALARADELLGRLGLSARAGAPARTLSAGEAQRVAIARALANRPAVVLADEPTGSLDSDASGRVLDAFAAVCADGAALLVATHDPAVADRAGRRLRMRDGRLAD